jgi:hypothetical protein
MRRPPTSPAALLLLAACLPSPPKERGGGPRSGADTAADTAPDADTAANTAPDADGDGHAAGLDCDDADPTRHPGAEERCDGLDQDCDGEVDEDPVDAPAWHRDRDGDGFGDGARDPVLACDAPRGHVDNGEDCDDASPSVGPWAVEACDGVDQDCDGEVDEGAADAPAWSADLDGDGLGGAGELVRACEAPPGHAPPGDCDDARADVHPGAAESCADALDADCDGSLVDGTPATFYPDDDGDGHGLYRWGVRGCAPPAGHVAGGADCDDADPTVYPGAPERCGDGVRNDCDRAPHSCGLLDGAATADAGVELRSYVPWAWAGYSVAPAGDVDGDGHLDVLIGADGRSAGGDRAGGAHLVRGPVTGPVDLAAAAATLVGESPFDYAGFSVAGAGDVNADGYDDLLVGAWGDDDAGVDAGAAYLLHGPVSGTLSLAAASVKLTGVEAGDLAGRVAGAGDVNADGFADLLIGSRREVTGGGAGAAHLVYGPVTASGSLWRSDARLIGASDAGDAGRAVAGAGDVNLDGYDDLLVGADLHAAGGAEAGAAFLVHGPVWGDLWLEEADAVLIGEDAGDHAGYAVSPGGDLNDDGHPDLLIGAPRHDGAGVDAGAAYVVYGPVTGELDLALADVRLLGAAAEDTAGVSVAAAGDVNGDGAADLVVGAMGSDEGGSTNRGAAVLVYGPLAGDVDLGVTGARVLGVGRDGLGRSVAGAGDLTGDGYDDLLLGGPYFGLQMGVGQVVPGGPGLGL